MNQSKKRVKFQQDSWLFKKLHKKRLKQCHHIIDIEHQKCQADDIHCGCFMATLIVRYITDIRNEIIIKGKSFKQQFSLNQGSKMFEDRERVAVFKEVRQLHDENCFVPVFIEESTSLKKQRAQIALIFLNEKRDATVKAREVHNDKLTRV